MAFLYSTHVSLSKTAAELVGFSMLSLLEHCSFRSDLMAMWYFIPSFCTQLDFAQIPLKRSSTLVNPRLGERGKLGIQYSTCIRSFHQLFLPPSVAFHHFKGEH